MKKNHLLLVLTILAVSCAKEKPAEKVFIEHPELHKTSSLISSFCTEEDKCLYVPSVANTPYNVTASRPFWQGEAKLVVGELIEDAFVLKEVETDERYQENTNNRSPVLKLKLRHVDYTCTEDAYGDCTNVQKEDEEKPWSKRRYVQFDKEGFDVQEINSLPIEFGELFQSGCFQETDKLVTKYAIEKDAINVSVKKTYRASANCVALNEIGDLRYLNFTVDYHYSVVKLSSLADKNYSIVDYPLTDKNTFGFFPTERKVKTVDNLDHVQGVRKTYLNRWSPDKKEIVYYLNEDFYKPENAYIMQATKEAINSVNFSLQKAKAGIQIKLMNGKGKDVGDLRNNFLVFVNDPQASGVIGYGPTVANPETGEIVKGQTVMYFGTIKKFISRTWDEIAESLNAAQQENEKNLGAANAKARELHAVKTQNEKAFVASLIASTNEYMLKDKANYVMRTQNRDSQELFRFLQNQSRRIEETEKSLYANVDKLMAQAEMRNSMIDKMGRETFYHASMFNFKKVVARKTVEREASQTAEAPTRYPFWDELNEKQREDLMQNLLPKVWIPTLVHEFGHNLGLRHNFNGSTDKENYYSKEERRALGIENEVTYSSIMDYSYSNLNELPVMGKYDIAALKFAYARKVEAKTTDENGKTSLVDIPVKTTLADLQKELSSLKTETPLELLGFKYCTDEDVGDDPLCNRFDEGSDYEEVAKHYVNSYFHDFDKRNFRNRKYEMNSIEGDLDYLNSVFSSFISMRSFFDQYDQLLLQSKLSKPSESMLKNLEGLKKASDYIFKAFMEVLETPAYHCIKVKVDKDGSLLGVMDIDAYEAKFAKEANLAFDMRYGCQYLTSISEDKSIQYYEFGKHFNNTLDFFTVDREKISENISQIDVRGFWLDKVLASYLMSYRMSSPSTIGTNSSNNFLDYEDYKERFDKFAMGLLSNTYSKQVVAYSMFNQKVPAISGVVKFGFDDSQVINKSYNWIVNAFFGLKNNRTSIKEVLVGFIKQNLEKAQFAGGLERNDSLYQSFDVARVSTSADISDYQFDKVIEFKDSSCSTSYKFGVYTYNTYGYKLSAQKEALDYLSQFKPESLVKILNARQKEEDETAIKLERNADTCSVTTSITTISEVDTDTLENYLAGRLNAVALLNSYLALAK